MKIKVNTVGENISIALSDNIPQPTADGIPESLVDLMDLMATVNKNRLEGIRDAFNLVQRELKENYPQLRRVLPAQLPGAMQALVDKGEMEPDVALSVTQLYELLEMPEWHKDQAGDTRGYAFLMLAEGAIHGIRRSALARSGAPGQEPPVGEQAAEAGDGTRLTWKERNYVTKGSRTVDLDGSYAATVRDRTMNGAWYQANRYVAGFTMTASAGTEKRIVPD